MSSHEEGGSRSQADGAGEAARRDHVVRKVVRVQRGEAEDDAGHRRGGKRGPSLQQSRPKNRGLQYDPLTLPFLSLSPQVEKKARERIPDARAHLFGSQAVGISTKASDIDLVILSATRLQDPTSSAAAKERSLNFMYDLAGDLSHGLSPPPFSHIEVIAHATVPIVKCRGRPGGFSVDISVGMEGGVRAAEMMKSKAKRFSAREPLPPPGM